mmetsp:Transcript_9946/g.27812  ORF Transcript_9946/g.27812 Transcript_9946/m.27812 type:complete len:257 (-) Transcript_9946:91-861(-)|eukprot:CAMPEP_0179097144 /NCGR_PEP_ID=MMETSP0796-20121207/44695_1 /TAXON_ID=73915 /ORGANISM="Pyrodinium bahamense, Strain pbaha01" /LENGTH=256 /DNA_ID=CAMNT_0020794879 /DNA_START=22 /DNA_END=792 /DNA_ORIENTATION=-
MPLWQAPSSPGMGLMAGTTLLLALFQAADGDAISGAAIQSVNGKGSSTWESLSNSFAMIIVTELGDKTFFIAALLAMRHARQWVFLGAISALTAMTVLSACIGLVLPALLPRKYTHWAAVVLFVYFGSKLLYEAAEMLRKGEGAGPSGELDEVEESLKDNSPKCKAAQATALQALTLTFLAEWGDRSQIATIALAAAKDPLGVTLGGIVGHSCCTSLAVLGGRVIATRISERVVLGMGGSLFIAFAVHGAIAGSVD